MSPRNLFQLISKKLYSSSSTVTARKYVLVKQFQGEPKKSDFKLVEEQLPTLKNEEYICEAEYFSVDPYMRAYMIQYPEGTDMIGSQVAKVIQSNNSKFPVGTKVVGNFGWRTHTHVTPEHKGIFGPPYILPKMGDLPSSLGLGVLGMPGITAYFGLLDICRPKAGETVAITGAAGAVGSHVGQIARIKGLKTIGFAGSDEKCEWLKTELGFDHALNYKSVNVGKALKEVAPKGIDCYFDNVGGEISSNIMNRMNLFGRVAVCGSISSYNADFSKMPKVPIFQPVLVFKQLKVEGFLVTRWDDRSSEAIQENLKWIQEGKLKHKEHITNGFENIFDAFLGMLRGENYGKAIVKV